MDFTELKDIAAGNTWSSIWPELSMGCLALFLLVLEIVLPRDQHRRIPACSILGQLVILALLFVNYDPAYRSVFNGLLTLSPEGPADAGLLPCRSILVSVLARASLRPVRRSRVWSSTTSSSS
jgi:NADH-quinone oxidoreductase subunit N